MRTGFLSIMGVSGLVAFLWHCGGSTAPVDAQGDASTADGSSSDGSTSDAATSDSSSDGSSASCSPACGQARACCKRGVSAGECVNLDNDPQNCGACGVVCGAGTYCDGKCKPIPCNAEGGSCPAAGGICCGSACCATGDICCKSEGPVGEAEPSCFTPTSTQTSCPQGCAPLCVSDRNLKTNIVAVDERAILDSVAKMPISRWSYKSDPDSVRHIGPMAQDFHDAFGGKTDRAYDPIDAHGVAFASIKALSEKLDEQNARINRLENENAELRTHLPTPERSTCR